MTTRRRKATVTRSRKATVEETETITLEETTPDECRTLAFAAGWQGVPQLTGPEIRAQRAEQVGATLMFLRIRVDDWNEAETVRSASNILRAGPASSLAERVHGRIT